MADVIVQISQLNERFPLPLVSFEEDEIAQQLLEIAPAWNIPTATIQGFKAGTHSAYVAKLAELTPEELVENAKVWEVTHKFLRIRGDQSEDEYQRGARAVGDSQIEIESRYNSYARARATRELANYVAQNPDHEVSKMAIPLLGDSNTGDLYHKIIKYTSFYIRQTLTRPFFAVLMEQTRNLIKVVQDRGGDAAVDAACSQTQSIDANEPEWKSRVVVYQEAGDLKAEFYPFADPESALRCLTRCVHLVLLDHFNLHCNKHYHDLPGDDTLFTRLGNAYSNAHWSSLYGALVQDETKNGPLPDQLQFFHHALELGARLERIPNKQMNNIHVRMSEPGLEPDTSEFVETLNAAFEIQELYSAPRCYFDPI